MIRLFKSNDRVGEIVAIFPGASEVFKEYKIDFCCGGDRTLSEVVKEQNINEEEVVSRLNKEYSEFLDKDTDNIDWNKESLSDLIDHIVNTHHAYLQKELPILGELTTKILRVHGIDHGEVLSKVHKLFNSLRAELEQHLIKEETLLFPIIKEYEKAPDKKLLEKGLKIMRETEDEHEGAGDILKQLRSITNQYQMPSSGCSSFSLTYRKLEELESDLFQHIHLENNILFPRFQGKE